MAKHKLQQEMLSSPVRILKLKTFGGRINSTINTIKTWWMGWGRGQSIAFEQTNFHIWMFQKQYDLSLGPLLMTLRNKEKKSKKNRGKWEQQQQNFILVKQCLSPNSESFWKEGSGRCYHLEKMVKNSRTVMLITYTKFISKHLHGCLEYQVIKQSIFYQCWVKHPSYLSFQAVTTTEMATWQMNGKHLYLIADHTKSSYLQGNHMRNRRGSEVVINVKYLNIFMG